MRAPIPRAAPEWHKATSRAAEFTIISEAAHWYSHWDPSKRRTMRCGGKECYCCATGIQKQLRVVVLVIDTNNREKLIELRERHREFFDHFASLVGLRIRVRKLGEAQNSPVEIRHVGEVHATVRDITRLVECLGSPAILVCSGDLGERFDRDEGRNVVG